MSFYTTTNNHAMFAYFRLGLLIEGAPEINRAPITPARFHGALLAERPTVHELAFLVKLCSACAVALLPVLRAYMTPERHTTFIVSLVPDDEPPLDDDAAHNARVQRNTDALVALFKKSDQRRHAAAT